MIVGWGEFRFFRLTRVIDGLKVDKPLVDHENISFTVNEENLARLPALFWKLPFLEIWNFGIFKNCSNIGM